MRVSVRLSLLVALGLVGLASASCGGDDVAVTEPTDPAAPTTATTSSEGTRPPGTVSDLQALAQDDRETVEQAMEDLAQRTGSEPDEIELVSFERVTWNDGSLGCPQPGEMYTQALVDGSRTLLEVGGTTYHYHAGSDGEPFLCENPRLGSDADSSGTAPGETER